jgi:hypothetical protein
MIKRYLGGENLASITDNYTYGDIEIGKGIYKGRKQYPSQCLLSVQPKNIMELTGFFIPFAFGNPFP